LRPSSSNLPTWHRYWRLRRRVLGVETLHEYDIKAPLTQDKDRGALSPGGGVDLRGDGAAGSRNMSHLAAWRAGEERWVDIYPNKGKRLGAFSYGGPGTHPFIYDELQRRHLQPEHAGARAGALTALLHSWRTQPIIYGRYTLFAAEVASNFNQALVRDYLLRDAARPRLPDRRARRGDEQLPPLFLYHADAGALRAGSPHSAPKRGEPLTAPVLNTLMADLFAEGYGDDLVMDRERTGSTWAQFSTHLYSNFYVYQYATGISGANALAQGVLAGQPGAVDRYLDFLHAGGRVLSARCVAARRRRSQRAGAGGCAFAVLADYVARLETLLL
jgi:oligoendopeptidase F